MKTKLLFLLALGLGSTAVAVGEPRIVKGKVLSDSDGEPMIGVAVSERGTTNGTITDADGNFSINVEDGAVLTISYMGYTTQNVKPVGNSPIKIELVEDKKMLDDVVVIGYGTQRKSDLTGSVAQIKAEDFQNRSTSDAAAALQGKAAGVQILTNSGAPGKGAEIRVRGLSSNSGNNGPLLIVDGLKVDNIQYLDPDMIESMEVLKDAASAAIYGAQAGNGVVLVTTKKGNKARNGKVFYNGQWSLSSLSRDLDVMNRDQYIDFITQMGIITGMDDLKKKYGYNGTDEVKWQDEVFENTWNSRHTIGFQGGNDHGSYFVALNHVKTDGIFVGSKDTYKRLSLQANGEYKVKEWLTVGINNSIEKWETKSVSQQSDNGSALLGAVTSDPLFGPYVSEENLPEDQKDALNKGQKLLQNSDGQYYLMSPITGNTQSGNPLIRRDAEDNPSNGFNIRGLAYLNFNPFDGFVFTSRFGYRLNQSRSRQFEFPFYANSFVAKSDYRLREDANQGYFYQWENFVNYNQIFAEKHAVGAMVGMSWQEDKSDNVWAEAKGVEGQDIFKYDTPNYFYLNSVYDNVKKNAGNEPSMLRSLSYFGRLTYAFDNRYSAQFNFRADAFDSSKLPEDSRWGKFSSFSAGWTASNESFIKDNIDTDMLSFLKFRGSWGKNGNINVLGGYPYRAVMKMNDMWYQYGKSTDMSYGSVPNGLANPNLVWESSEQLDLGLDARFLNDRLTLGLDWYKKTTNDFLITVMPVIESGVGSTVINAGEVDNKGLEIEIGWDDTVGKDFHYSVNANFATLKNEFKTLPSQVDYLPGSGIQGSNIQTRCAVGEPLWYFHGYKTAGLDENGAVLYKHADGTASTTPNAEEMTNIGCGLPKVTYGITINLDYKGFDFLLFGTGVAGNKIAPTAFRPDRLYCNTYAWFYEKAGSEFPAVSPANWTQDAFSTDMCVFNGSYFKFKQIQLGYTLPASISKKAFIDNMRVYASLENFFTITKYIGLDPETASANTNTQLGFDFGTYPTAKQFIMGLNVTF